MVCRSCMSRVMIYWTEFIPPSITVRWRTCLVLAFSIFRMRPNGVTMDGASETKSCSGKRIDLIRFPVIGSLPIHFSRDMGEATPKIRFSDELPFCNGSRRSSNSQKRLPMVWAMQEIVQGRFSLCTSLIEFIIERLSCSSHRTRKPKPFNSLPYELHKRVPARRKLTLRNASFTSRMNVSPRSSRISLGSISRRLGAGRIPRRLFQYEYSFLEFSCLIIHQRPFSMPNTLRSAYVPIL